MARLSTAVIALLLSTCTMAIDPITGVIIAHRVAQTSIAMIGAASVPRMLPLEARLGRVIMRRATTTVMHSSATPMTSIKETAKKWQGALKRFGRIKVVVRKYVHWCLYGINICIMSSAGIPAVDPNAEEIIDKPIGLLVLYDTLKEVIDSQCQ